jgi:hypothetical protein
MNLRVKVMICGGGKADSCVVGTEGLLVTLNVAHSATVVISAVFIMDTQCQTKNYFSNVT